MGVPNFIIVSQNPNLGEVLSFYLESLYHANVAKFDDETQALSFFNNDADYPVIFIYDYRPGTFLVEDLYIHLKQNRKNIHIVIINDFFSDHGKELLEDLSYFHLQERDQVLQDLNNLVERIFPLTSIIEVPCRHEYYPISIACLEAFKGVEHALYLQLPSGKKLKISHEDDELDLKKYKDKNVKQLFIKADQLPWIHKQTRKQFGYLLKDPKFHFQLKDPVLVQKESLNEKVIHVTEDLYLEEDYKRTILTLMDKAIRELSRHPKLEELINKIDIKSEKIGYYSKRIRLMCIIGSFIARELEWNSVATLEKIIFASFLHDVTIAHDRTLLSIRDREHFERIKDQLTEKQQKMYLEHPQNASNLLDNSFSSVPFEVNTLVEQHHEIPNGKGFPGGLKWDKISPLSALFIVTNDFVHYILEDDFPMMDDYRLIAEKRFNVSIFKKIVAKLSKLKINLNK
jgi:HD-GYP domain-containing protein (c-di-GMP phosphodiesterase class II)